jgi:hypothetical protein
VRGSSIKVVAAGVAAVAPATEHSGGTDCCMHPAERTTPPPGTQPPSPSASARSMWRPNSAVQQAASNACAWGSWQVLRAAEKQNSPHSSDLAPTRRGL